VSGEKHASKFFVSGVVQGVGFRYFVQDAAERLRLTGYVRNLRDGRVEVYAIGALAQFTRLRAALEEGPRGAMVTGIVEELAPVDTQFEHEFSITDDR
jgi:acylphosphatase